MMRLNRNAAKLMCRFGANGATDITGFGLLGHASNLAAVQKAEVSIEIRKMPIIRPGAPCHDLILLHTFTIFCGVSKEKRERMRKA